MIQNRAYWEKLYGGDPLNSPNHPVSPPSNLVPRPTPAGDVSHNLFDPSPMDSNASGPFGSGGRLVPGATTSLQPSGRSASTDAIDDGAPVRRLGARTGDTPSATVFHSGAPAVPFASPSPIPRSRQSATFNERFPAPDDLEAFRRQWLKALMEP